MKTNRSVCSNVFAVIIAAACTMFISSTASAQSRSSEVYHYFSAGVSVGYAFGEKGGVTVGPVLNYEVLLPEANHNAGVGGTFQAMYRSAGAWNFALAGRGGYFGPLSAQAELGLAYHTGYGKRPGGYGVHLGASAPLTLLLIDAGPSARAFLSTSDGVDSEFVLGGDALFPSAIIEICGQAGCGFN